MTGFADLPTPWPLRVLALWQPWASLCVLQDERTGRPPKRWETRHWMPRFPMGAGGNQPIQHGFPLPVAIHATKGWKTAGRAAARLPKIADALGHCGIMDAVRELPTGAIVGVGMVVKVSLTHTVRSDVRFRDDPAQEAMGDFSVGRYAWELAYTAPLAEPIPYTGKQTPLYLLEPAPLAAIMTQVGGFLEGAPVFQRHIPETAGQRWEREALYES